jgi:hypothetical protein
MRRDPSAYSRWCEAPVRLPTTGPLPCVWQVLGRPTWPAAEALLCVTTKIIQGQLPNAVRPLA